MVLLIRNMYVIPISTYKLVKLKKKLKFTVVIGDRKTKRTISH